MSTKNVAKWLGALGNAFCTTINKITITQPDNGATLTIADGKTLTCPNDASIAGTNTGDQTLNGLGGVPTTRTVNGVALSADINVVTAQESLTIGAGDVTAGWKALVGKCVGAVGAKTHVRIVPMGGPEQQYGVDFTAMNNDANTATIVIWKTSGVVTGIASPVYPSTGMAADISSSPADVLQVYYE